jgi:hypothetical protein
METLLHGYLIFTVLSMLLVDPRRYFALGFLTGLSVWVRPDGITLLGPVIFTALLLENNSRDRGNAVAKILVSFGALLVPYLLFNLALAGTPLPSTFYAKQAEYQAAWLSRALVDRLNEYLLPIIASPFLVLVPGAVIWLYKRIRKRDWAAIATLIWFLGYITLYFMRLPAYQHGRYIIPAFPILYLWGVLGAVEYLTAPKANRRIVLVWSSLIGGLCLFFTVVAARQNASDVYWIESQMVETAKWVQENIPPDALLAVHDIGAIGYFDRHAIIDLAGLVSPEVIPFIRDEAKLAAFLDQRGANYLVTLPSFYPGLVVRGKQVYPPAGSCPSLPSGATMCVFRWK